MDIVDFINQHGLHTSHTKNQPIALCFNAESNSPDSQLNLAVYLDDHEVQRITGLQQRQTVEIQLADSPGQHQLRLVMSGKQSHHTCLDSQGHIQQDAVITVTDVTLDHTDITDIFISQGIYYHDFNGLARVQYQVPWHGVMGCNGTVQFDFRTPYYDWLLETM